MLEVIGLTGGWGPTTIVERLEASLAPRGLLLVGASESLLRFGTVFECEEHGGAFFYRKGGA